MADPRATAELMQEVILPGQPPLRGPVMELKHIDGRLHYKVYLSKDDKRWVRADQVILVPLEPELRALISQAMGKEALRDIVVDESPESYEPEVEDEANGDISSGEVP